MMPTHRDHIVTTRTRRRGCQMSLLQGGLVSSSGRLSDLISVLSWQSAGLSSFLLSSQRWWAGANNSASPQCFLSLSIVKVHLDVESVKKAAKLCPPINLNENQCCTFCVGVCVPVCGETTPGEIERQLLATLLTLKFHFTYTSRIHKHMFAVHIANTWHRYNTRGVLTLKFYSAATSPA